MIFKGVSKGDSNHDKGVSKGSVGGKCFVEAPFCPINGEPETCCRAPTKIADGHFGFVCFAFVNICCFLPLGFCSHANKSL